jgi:hypothetical protein
MISLFITILIDYEKNKHIRDETHGFGQNFKPVMGTGFFNGYIYFSRIQIWDDKT